jgi:hypothetical protein
MNEYLVRYGESTSDITLIINEVVKAGWRLFGAVSISHDSKNSRTYYCATFERTLVVNTQGATK